MMNSPIILTGRGGSGTRLLSDIVSASGVFLGNDLNVSSDSTEWVELIYAMAIQKLNGKDNETSPQDWTVSLQSKAAEILTQADGSGASLWGFKLPETVLVLPELLAAFPSAKIVHLVRHPVHTSLRRTHMTSRMNNPIGRAVLTAAYQAHDRDLRLIDSDAEHFHNAISWNFQVSQAVDFARSMLHPDNYLELQFEALCANLSETISRIQKFMEAPPAEIAPPELNLSRLRQFELSDPRIEAVWNYCKNTAVSIGYQSPTDVTV